MDYFKSEQYKDAKERKYKFPEASQKKDNQFFLQYFEAMYSEYVKDRGGIPYSRRFDFNLYDLYAEGNQPTEKYMDILCPREKKADGKIGDREGWMNISWDILSVAPKFERIFVGMFEKVEHEVTVSAINDKALEEKEDAKWNMWATKELQDFFSAQDKLAGIQSSEPDWLPNSISELEMFMNDSFKLPTEMGMEMGIDYAFYLSNWREIKKRMLKDWFRKGVAFCEDYVDPVDKKIKVRYLEPQRVIVRYSKNPDFSNIDYWGYMDDMTISELRVKSGFDEDTLKSIAMEYVGYANNVVDFDWNGDYYNLTGNITNANNSELPWNNFRVNVMRGQFITSNTEVYKTKNNEDGSRKSFLIENWSEDRKKNNTPKKSYETHKYQVSMEGWWITGTKFTFGCGKSYIQPREEFKYPKLSLNAYKYANKSILASIIPNLDSFQLAWLKLQNAKVLAAPAGLDIQIGALENIDMGDGKMSPLQILSLRRQTGDLIYNLTTHHSEVNQAGSASPVSERQGGMGTQLKEFIESMEYDITLIRSITGINEVIDSSAPAERAPVKTSMVSVEAANNALQPIYSGYVSVKEGASKKIVTRYQTLAAQGDIKGYLPSLGRNVMQVFTITSAVSHEDYALKIVMKPTDEMKQAIRETAMEAVKLGPKQGGISQGDYLYIEDKIQNGNLKYARMYLSYKEKVYEKQAQAMQQQNMQLNGQNASQIEQTKGQNEVMKINAQRDADLAIEDKKGQNLLAEETLKHQNKMEEIAQTALGKGHNIVTKAAVEPLVEAPVQK